MKKKMIAFITVISLLVICSFSSFAIYYATESELLEAFDTNALSVTVCQQLTGSPGSTYNTTQTHANLGCKKDSSYASTTITYSSGHGTNCYAEVHIYNTSGVHASYAYKKGGSLNTIATAKVRANPSEVSKVLHAGDVPQYCSSGEHCYLASTR